MSGFFGIFRPQGGPVDLEAFEQMKTAMHRNGFDGMETHVAEKIAFGHLMLRVSPESQYDKQPLKSSCGNYILVGHFRLDYRDELGDKLGLTQSELGVTPDSQLVMLAYQKWKKKCVHHLEGDWAFVVFSFHENRLLFFKDRYGISAICYKIENGVIYFSSDPSKFVFKFIDSRTINIEQLCRLGYVGIGVEEGKTLFNHIFILKNAHILSINQNAFAQEERYYSLNILESLRFLKDEDCSFELQSIYVRAILSRIRGEAKIGSFLSSGLDSTSVVHFSSLLLSQVDSSLSTFTSFPEYLNEVPEKYHSKLNERPLVEIFQRGYKNIDAHYLSLPTFNILNLFSTDLINDPIDPIITSNSFWIKGIYSTAQEGKIKKMLTGQMGNFTISWHGPFNQVNLLSQLKISQLFREIREFRENENCSFFFAIKEKIFSEHYRQFITLRYNLLKSKFDLSDFNKQFLRDYQSSKLSLFIARMPGYRLFFSSRAMRHMLLMRSLAAASYLHYRDSNNHCLEVVDPTADIRLIEFSFSISESLFNKRGTSKYIYRKMMEFQLPKEILFQKLKIAQSADILNRLEKVSIQLIALKKELQLGQSRKIVKDDDLDFTCFLEQNDLHQINLSRRMGMFLLRNLSLSCFVNNNYCNFKN